MKKALGIINIVLPIILFIALQFFNMSPSFVNIMTLTLIIGWILPFIFPIITGICMLLDIHHKKSIAINIITIILLILIIYLIIQLYDSKLLHILIIYIILAVLKIINSIYLIIHYKKINHDNYIEQKKENQRI